MRRWAWFVGACALLGLIVSIGMHAAGIDAVLPQRTEIQVAVETGAALAALLAAFLTVGRYLRSRLLRDILLVAALALTAATSMLTWTLPVVGLDARWSQAAWELAVLRVFVGGLVLAATWSPTLRAAPRRAAVWIVAIGALVAVWGVAGMLGVADRLPSFGVPGVGTATLHPAAVALEVTGALALSVGCAALWRSSRRTDDPFIMWLAAAFTASVLSRINYAMVPTLYTSEVHLGDLFRLVSHLLLLTGALQEISRSWRRFAEDTLVAERRRIARELHDGVAQEVSYILGVARRLQPVHSGGPGAPSSGQIAGEAASDPTGAAASAIEEAAVRALDETRSAIETLARSPAEPLDQVLLGVAEELASRRDARVLGVCAPGIRLSPVATHALARIVREAVTNALTHGGASRIDLELAGRSLQIVDDGAGFDVLAVANGEGFGLRSMRERARLLGGDLAVTSEIGVGTTVVVRW